MSLVPAECVALVKHFEGCYLKAYLCPAAVWTVGYGATGEGVGPGVVWTKQEAEARLVRDLEKCAQQAVRLSPKLLTEDLRRAAIVSFVFNCGAGAYRASTLRRKIDAGDWEGAKAQILKWNKGGGKVLPGLTRRRKAEAALL